MPALGITGGIGTGKSTFSRALVRELSAEFFDADACSHELLATNPDVRSAVRANFGTEILNTDGIPDRALLRERVFRDADARRQLEAILHPAIRRSWETLAAQAQTSKRWHCFEIPLLYEAGAEAHFDRVVVVACSPATQHQRLCAQRGLSVELATQIVAAQLDLREKMTRAHHLIWNDSTPHCMEAQTALLSGWLRQRYGPH